MDKVYNVFVIKKEEASNGVVSSNEVATISGSYSTLDKAMNAIKADGGVEFDKYLNPKHYCQYINNSNGTLYYIFINKIDEPIEDAKIAHLN